MQANAYNVILFVCSSKKQTKFIDAVRIQDHGYTEVGGHHNWKEESMWKVSHGEGDSTILFLELGMGFPGLFSL